MPTMQEYVQFLMYCWSWANIFTDLSSCFADGHQLRDGSANLSLPVRGGQYILHSSSDVIEIIVPACSFKCSKVFFTSIFMLFFFPDESGLTVGKRVGLSILSSTL